MQSSSIDRHQFLIEIIHELVEHLRYNNSFVFDLLKAVTINKNAIIDIDGVQLQLHATVKNKYHLQIVALNTLSLSSFKSTGDDLRDIVNGRMTLDKALSTNKVFAKGHLEDLLGIYRLAIGLLIEGPTDPNLRKIWDKFDKHWQTASDHNSLPILDEQQVYSYFPFQDISEEVALVRIVL